MSSIVRISIANRAQRFSASRMESDLGYLDSFIGRLFLGKPSMLLTRYFDK